MNEWRGEWMSDEWRLVIWVLAHYSYSSVGALGVLETSNTDGSYICKLIAQNETNQKTIKISRTPKSQMSKILPPHWNSSACWSALLLPSNLRVAAGILFFESCCCVIRYSISHQPRVTPHYLPCQIVHLIRWSFPWPTLPLLLRFKFMLFSSAVNSIFLSKGPSQMFSYSSLSSFFSPFKAVL